MRQLIGSPAMSQRVVAELERETGIKMHTRGTEVSLVGGSQEDQELVDRLLRELYQAARSGDPIETHDLARALEVLREMPDISLRDVYGDRILSKGQSGKAITPRSLAQKRYVDALRKHHLTFGVGPAGTGKTYLAVAMAVRRFLDKEVRRIILTRPAIEAGENLGFLPGTLEEKISPYMRPLYDALFDMLGRARTLKFLEEGVIEVAPLAYMRGRTLNEAFIILDEAQNTTREQMKMFLTRIGMGSWAVVTGDPSQNDLGHAEQSGLSHALSVLRNVRSIAVRRFSDTDVMRHTLVQDIVRAYDEERARRQRRINASRAPGSKNDSRNGGGAKSPSHSGAEIAAKPA